MSDNNPLEWCDKHKILDECGEPVASPQATRHVIDHTTCINVEDEIEYMKWIDKRNAAQPAAGTTPQAERLVAELKAARTAWHEDFGVPVSEKYANFLEAIGKLTDYIEARAVAPVETPDK